MILSTPPYECQVFDSLKGMDSYLSFWRENLEDPEADPDFCSFIIKSRPEIIRPYFLVVLKDGKPVVMAIGRVENGVHEIKAGYKTLARLKVKRLTLFYGGFFGDTFSKAGDFALQRMRQSLIKEDLHQLVMPGVIWKGDLHERLDETAGCLGRDYLARPVAHHRMTMPASLDELLEKKMNKKHRYWAKRTAKQLEKDFPNTVELRSFRGLAHKEEFFRDVLLIARQTYQWALGVGFRDSPEQKDRLELEMRHDWTRGYILYIQGKPVAFWICLIYGDTIYSAYTGYNPDFRKYEVGTALFLKMVGLLCSEQKKELDFGLGSALYKDRFGDLKFEEANIRVCAPRVSSIALNLLSVMTETPMVLARTLLQRLGLEQKLKTAWRARAVKSAGALQPQAAD